jgi:ribosomal peptide maturation radical SAM protein 1
MYRVTLLNMPFAALTAPSLALTQLKARIEAQFEGRVRVRVLYLNHDFAHYLGLPSYRYLADSLEANMCGLGDWFFRDSAFPDVPNNTEEYWQRFFPQRDDKFELRRQLLLKKRQGLESLLSRLIAKYELSTDDLMGFTSMFAQNVACFALAKRLKERRPEIVTVMGGANCEAAMGQEVVRQINQIDFVFSGPALVSFPQFVGYQLNREEALCHDIRGVFSKQNVRLCPVGGANAIGEELNIDTEVQLDYEPFLAALDQNFPAADVGPTLQFETSRGCWWGERAHCTFCGLNGTTMAYRAMRSEKAIEQFKRLFSYWPRCSRFESVDNIMPKQYLADVFPYLDPPPQSTIFYEVKADLRADELKRFNRG